MLPLFSSILFLFSVFLWPSSVQAVDLTEVSALGAAKDGKPQDNMLYGFLNNLVPSKPFQVPYILLSTSMPKVALEKFGFPEVDLDSKSKKIVFV